MTAFDEMLSNMVLKLKEGKRAKEEKHLNNKRIVDTCSLRTMSLDDTNTSLPKLHSSKTNKMCMRVVCAGLCVCVRA